MPLMVDYKGKSSVTLSPPGEELAGIGGESKGYEAVLSSLHPDLRSAQSQLFTTFNGSHTRCEAVFPGNEASISILQCKIGPLFS